MEDTFTQFGGRAEHTDVCRVCRMGDGVLSRPCKCSGSMGFVHQECLLEWLKHSRKKHCEICKHKFKFRPVYRPGAPSTLPLHELITGLVRRGFPTAARCILATVHWLVLVPTVLLFCARCGLLTNPLVGFQGAYASGSWWPLITDIGNGWVCMVVVGGIVYGIASLRFYMVRHNLEHNLDDWHGEAPPAEPANVDGDPAPGPDVLGLGREGMDAHERLAEAPQTEHADNDGATLPRTDGATDHVPVTEAAAAQHSVLAAREAAATAAEARQRAANGHYTLHLQEPPESPLVDSTALLSEQDNALQTRENNDDPAAAAATRLGVLVHAPGVAAFVPLGPPPRTVPYPSAPLADVAAAHHQRQETPRLLRRVDDADDLADNGAREQRDGGDGRDGRDAGGANVEAQADAAERPFLEGHVQPGADDWDDNGQGAVEDGLMGAINFLLGAGAEDGDEPGEEAPGIDEILGIRGRLMYMGIGTLLGLAIGVVVITLVLGIPRVLGSLAMRSVTLVSEPLAMAGWSSYTAMLGTGHVLQAGLMMLLLEYVLPGPNIVKRLLRYGLRLWVYACKVVGLMLLSIFGYRIVVGWVLDYCTLAVFGATLAQRREHFREDRLLSLFLHWMVPGDLTEGFLGGVLHDTAHFYALRLLGQEHFFARRIYTMVTCSLTWHVRRLVAYFLVDTVLAGAFFYMPVTLAKSFFPSQFPVRINEPFSWRDYFSVMTQYVLTMVILDSHITAIRWAGRAWIRWLSTFLGVHGYLRAPPNEDAGHHHHHHHAHDGGAVDAAPEPAAANDVAADGANAEQAPADDGVWEDELPLEDEDDDSEDGEDEDEDDDDEGFDDFDEDDMLDDPDDVLLLPPEEPLPPQPPLGLASRCTRIGAFAMATVALWTCLFVPALVVPLWLGRAVLYTLFGSSDALRNELPVYLAAFAAIVWLFRLSLFMLTAMGVTPRSLIKLVGWVLLFALWFVSVPTLVGLLIDLAVSVPIGFSDVPVTIDDFALRFSLPFYVMGVSATVLWFLFCISLRRPERIPFATICVILVEQFPNVGFGEVLFGLVLPAQGVLFGAVVAPYAVGDIIATVGFNGAEKDFLAAYNRVAYTSLPFAGVTYVVWRVFASRLRRLRRQMRDERYLVGTELADCEDAAENVPPSSAMPSPVTADAGSNGGNVAVIAMDAVVSNSDAPPVSTGSPAVIQGTDLPREEFVTATQ